LCHNLGDLSRGFLHFFMGESLSPILTFTGVRPPERHLLPLTPLVYHRPHQKSIFILD
jgi:hypothetical protein